ncbi:MAG: hypothetical protein AABX60_00540, partial [Nanoarchaeota archaeon]
PEKPAQPEAPKDVVEKKSILEQVSGFGFAAKVVWTLVLTIAGILIVIEVMHFMHRKIPPKLRLKLPEIPPPSTIP